MHRGVAYLLMRDYLRGGAAQYIHGLTLQVNLMILGYVSGAYEAGLYAFASMVAVQINSMIATKVGEVMQPILGRLQGDRSRQARVFVQSQQILGAVCIPLALLQAALAEPLFQLYSSIRSGDPRFPCSRSWRCAKHSRLRPARICRA